MQVKTKYCDPLRRLTPTPHVAELRIMGRTLRLETNSVTVANCLTRLFARYPGPRSAQLEFLWKIVTETQADANPPWPEMTAFSDRALRYVNLGQRSFFAIDLESREAVAFLPEEWAKDELGFTSVFLTTLFDMTAGALRLIQISAACVALRNKALLIFGPPRSGKTTSTYYAGKAGLEFHADQVAFIELERGGLQAWGQFWPAAFRPETSRFLPDLATRTRSFTYGTLTFLCFKRHPFRPPKACHVVPVGCVFLERQALKEPRLIRMPSSAVGERLKKSLPFEDDERFKPQREAVLRALGELPAYRLPYSGDPAEVVELYRSLLKNHDRAEGEL